MKRCPSDGRGDLVLTRELDASAIEKGAGPGERGTFNHYIRNIKNLFFRRPRTRIEKSRGNQKKRRGEIHEKLKAWVWLSTSLVKKKGEDVRPTCDEGNRREGGIGKKGAARHPRLARLDRSDVGRQSSVDRAQTEERLEGATKL